VLHDEPDLRQIRQRQADRWREKDGRATTDLPITMRLAEPPEPAELVRSA